MTVFLESYKVYAYLNGAWVDLTSDCISDDIRAKWGMMGNTPFDRLATTGPGYFQLNNSTLKYSPGTPGALSGWQKGVPIIYECMFDGTPHIRFRGNVEKIDLKTGLKAKRVYVTVLDWMEYAAKYPVTSQGYLANRTADEALGFLVPTMPALPQATDYAEGVSTFPAIFDSLNTKTKAYTEFSKLVFSEPGQIYLKKDKEYGETLVFESAHTRNGLRALTEIPKADSVSGFLLQENGDYLLQENLDKIILGRELEAFESDNSMMDADIDYGEQIINRVEVKAYPKRIDTTEQVLFSLDTPLEIGSGETIEFVGQYKDPAGGSVNAIPYMMIDPNETTELGPRLSVTYTLPGIPGTTTKVWHGATYDTYARSNLATTNYDGDDDLQIGELNTGASYKRRAWIKWDELSDGTIPADATVIEAHLQLCVYTNYADSSETFYVYRPLRAWISNQLTWNIWSTGNAWATAGGFGAADCEQTSIGEAEFQLNVLGWRDFTLDNTAIEEMISGGFTNNGFMIRSLTEDNDGYRVWSSNKAMAPEDFMMRRKINGGADISAYLTVEPDYTLSTSSVHYTLTNTYSSTAYINKLQARGIGIYTYTPMEAVVENAASYESDNGYQVKVLDQIYQRNTAQGVIEAKKIVNTYKQPQTILNKVTFCANRSGALMEAFLNLDVGDLVSIKEDDAGIDGWYYIQAVEFTIGLGGVIMFSWRVIAACSLLSGCLAPVAIELDGTSSGINYGYLPQVANLPERSISFDVYPYAAAPVATPSTMVGITSDDGGNWVGFGANSNIIVFYSNRFDAGPGNWVAFSDAIPLNAWANIVITYYPEDIAADPIIYIDGVSVAVTENYTPLGDLNSEDGISLVLGNIKTATIDYTWGLNGVLKNMKIYNVILTAIEAADIAAGLDVNRGLVFNGLNVKTKDLSYFDNRLLDPENDSLIDDMYGVIGTPHDPTTTQLIPYP